MSKCLDTLEQLANWEDQDLEVEALSRVRSASVIPGALGGPLSGYLHGLTSVLAPQISEIGVLSA